MISLVPFKKHRSIIDAIGKPLFLFKIGWGSDNQLGQNTRWARQIAAKEEGIMATKTALRRRQFAAVSPGRKHHEKTLTGIIY